MKTGRRTAAVLAAVLLSAGAVVAAAPPAVAARYPPAGGYRVVTVSKLTTIRVVTVKLHPRPEIVWLNRVGRVSVAVTEVTSDGPQLTPRIAAPRIGPP